MSEVTERVKLEASWKPHLLPEFEKPYMLQLREFLLQQKQAGKTIYPPGNQFFNALELTPFNQVKVVILGQDPYHGPHQAHGLCFSVQPGVQQPPSLKNIFKEIQEDLDIQPPNHGCLESWAKQGVLLLNSVLSVEQNQAASHQGKGWETFTDHIIHVLNQHHDHLVFLLWGSYAQRKGQFIDRERHCVLQSPHPSPLSAHRGFLGNRHFSKTNQYLRIKGKTEINWSIDSL